MTRVLVATDFEELSASALTYGRDLAGKFGADLHVIHVVADLGQVAMGAPGAVMDVTEIQRNLERAADEQLAVLVATTDGAALRAKTVRRTARHPAEAIVEYAKEAAIDVIVVGTHGRRGLAHMVMGSVAERVVRTAPCPVIVVK